MEKQTLWIPVELQKPDFDTLVIVRGKHPSTGAYLYAVAYNELYPPKMGMTQVVRAEEGTIYPGLGFEILDWMSLEYE
jgi:hypothetical protein